MDLLSPEKRLSSTLTRDDPSSLKSHQHELQGIFQVRLLVDNIFDRVNEPRVLLQIFCFDCFPLNGSALFMATEDLFTDSLSQDRISSILRFFGHGGKISPSFNEEDINVEV
jgi:hypothetical protein